MTDPTAASYDRIARRYAAEIGDELADRPFERALLAAYAELAGPGRVVDLGCGPGHVTAHLRSLGVDASGLDVSREMVEVARERVPGASFEIGSMLDLPCADASLDGAVALYSVIHLDRLQRRRAYAEMTRAVRPGGVLLLGFHVEGTTRLGTHRRGESATMTTWWDQPVDLTFHFLDPVVETTQLAGAWDPVATLEREPLPTGEAQTRRAYLLLRRGDTGADDLLLRGR